ncbi:hypothetical protein FZEAL_1390 [Fusarium zealandicum]|uniref:Uncharacterized protein n=1 Tax=Fusarium zealandicum TaxID=1053134 RepID=A0A8H4XPE4_9HYPO|nr:hypothetical protein FZEAL_1390 [Fusarium zealandicum]
MATQGGGELIFSHDSHNRTDIGVDKEDHTLLHYQTAALPDLDQTRELGARAQLPLYIHASRAFDIARLRLIPVQWCLRSNLVDFNLGAMKPIQKKARLEQFTWRRNTQTAPIPVKKGGAGRSPATQPVNPFTAFALETDTSEPRILNRPGMCTTPREQGSLLDDTSRQVCLHDSPLRVAQRPFVCSTPLPPFAGSSGIPRGGAGLR